MKNFIHTFSDLQNLELFLSNPDMQSLAKCSKSVLMQIFSASNDTELILEMVQKIREKYPEAVIAGATTVGEIAYGQLELNTTVLSLSFFDSTMLRAIHMPCPAGKENATGEDLTRKIFETDETIAGVLLLATPLTINLANLFDGMQNHAIDFPVFGGGAGIYDYSANSLVFCENIFLYEGIVAVVFQGSDLHIYADSYLGWQPLTKEMTITDSDGVWIKTVDNMPIYDLYKKYLDINEENTFFHNVLEFPILLERDGFTVARVPFAPGEDGSIQFTADVNKGEKFRIGHGNPELIMQNAESMQKDLHKFKPDAIFIYSCICCRFLMQDDVNLEIHPFNAIADTVGFFTFGEFIRGKNKIHLLNSTTVIVGMREGPKTDKPLNEEYTGIEDDFKPIITDPYSDKHTQIVSRLLHFIGSLTSELEEANNELKLLSEIDKLTQISNRMKLDKTLSSEILKSGLNHTDLSVILFDIDSFKAENDMHGHISGDAVLVRLAGLLKTKVRKTDTFGRWGGDEFLLILPLASLEQACSIAETLRKEVAAHTFDDGKRLTCSFGVASYLEGDNPETLTARADKALYEAKYTGRNRVKCLR